MTGLRKPYSNFQLAMSLVTFNTYLDTGDLWGTHGLSGRGRELGVGRCQEIGLVAFMFFFELLFSYVFLAISFYVSFTNLFSIALSLI